MSGEVWVSGQENRTPTYTAEILYDPELVDLLDATIQSPRVSEASTDTILTEESTVLSADMTDDFKVEQSSMPSDEVIDVEPVSVEIAKVDSTHLPLSGKKSTGLRAGTAKVIMAPTFPSPEVDSDISGKTLLYDQDNVPDSTDSKPATIIYGREETIPGTDLGIAVPEEGSENVLHDIPRARASVSFGDKHLGFIEVVGTTAEKLKEYRKKQAAEKQQVDNASKKRPEKPKAPILIPVAVANKTKAQMVDQDVERESTPPSTARIPIPDHTANERDDEVGMVTIHQLDAINLLDDQGIKLNKQVIDQRNGTAYFTDMRIMETLKTVCLQQADHETDTVKTSDVMLELLNHEEKRLLIGFRDIAAELRDHAVAARKQPSGLRKITQRILPSEPKESLAMNYIKRQQNLIKESQPNISTELLKPESIIDAKMVGLRQDLSPESFMDGGAQGDSGRVNTRIRKQYFSGRPSNQQIIAADNERMVMLITYPDAKFLFECTNSENQELESVAVRPLRGEEYERMISCIIYLTKQID